MKNLDDTPEVKQVKSNSKLTINKLFRFSFKIFFNVIRLLTLCFGGMAKKPNQHKISLIRKMMDFLHEIESKLFHLFLSFVTLVSFYRIQNRQPLDRK